MSKAEFTLTPAPVTLGRVTRYFELLCRFGFDEIFDEVAEQRRPPSKPTKSIGEALAGGRDEEGPYVKINLGRILREIAKGGALIDLGLIVFEETEEARIQDCPADDFRLAFFGFARASHALLSELAAFGASYG